MLKKYTSSIVNKYGDRDNVKTDVKILRDIIARQGNSLLIDVIAEATGETANKFKFNNIDRRMIMDALVDELKNALKERLY